MLNTGSGVMDPQEWKLGSASAVTASAVSKWITDAFQQSQDCIQLLKCATSQALLVCYTLARSIGCAKIVTIRGTNRRKTRATFSIRACALRQADPREHQQPHHSTQRAPQPRELKYARIDARRSRSSNGRRRLPPAAHRAAINDAHKSGDGPDRRLRLLVAQERHDVDAGHRRAFGGAGPVQLGARLRGHAVL